jgi:hypothetical protein
MTFWNMLGFTGEQRTLREAVRNPLRRKNAYRDALVLRGKVRWEGDPAAMRRAHGR